MSSATATNEEVLMLAGQVKSFVPLAAERLPAGFLTLAPTTSASYPQRKKLSVSGPSVTEAAVPTADAAAVAAIAPPVDSAAIEAKQRRSSSQSSAGGLRFLKLGPVHWGEHLGEHQEDWHEVAVEES